MRVVAWGAMAFATLTLAASGASAAPERAAPVTVVGQFGDPAAADAAIFSPNGKLMALPGGGFGTGELTLWEIASGLPLRTLRDRAFITASAFAPDGTILATGHKDGSIRLWRVETGAVAATLQARPLRRGQEAEPVTALWFDDKGEVLVAGDGAGIATVWTVATRRPALTVRQPKIDRFGSSASVVAARLTADRRRLVVLLRDTATNTDAVAEYDARSGAQGRSFKLSDGHSVLDNGLVADDTAIVRVTGEACPRGELMQFSLADRAVVAGIYKPADCARPKDGGDGEPAAIFASAASPLIAVVPRGDPELRLWNTETRRLERAARWPDVAGARRVLGFAGDFRMAAVVEAGRLRLRDVDSGAPIRELASGTAMADNAILSADSGHIAIQREAAEGAATIDLDLRRIDDPRPASLRLTPGAGYLVYDVAPGPMLGLAGGEDGQILVFPLAGGGEPRKVPVPGLKNVERARLSPDGKSALVLGEPASEAEAAGSVAVLVDAADGKVRLKVTSPDYDDSPTAVAFSPDGASFAIGRRDGSADLWATATAQKIKSLPVYKEDGDVRSLAFSPDGRFLVGGGMFDDDVFMWNVAAGKTARVFKMAESLANYRYATAVALSRDGKTVVAGLGQRAVSSGDLGAERGGIAIWDAATGRRRMILRGHRGAVFALTFSPGDKWIVSGGLDGTIRYWDRNDGRLMATSAATADGRWLTLTEAGFYAGSDGSGDLVSVVRGNRAVPGARLRDALLRPDLVAELLKGDPDGRYRAAARALDFDALLKSVDAGR